MLHGLDDSSFSQLSSGAHSDLVLVCIPFPHDLEQSDHDCHGSGVPVYPVGCVWPSRSYKFEKFLKINVVSVDPLNN